MQIRRQDVGKGILDDAHHALTPTMQMTRGQRKVTHRAGLPPVAPQTALPASCWESYPVAAVVASPQSGREK